MFIWFASHVVVLTYYEFLIFLTNLLHFQLLLASPSPQSYGTNSRNVRVLIALFAIGIDMNILSIYSQLSSRNNTVSRTRKVDVFDKRQIGDTTTSGCSEIFCENDPNYPKHIIQSLDLEKFEHLFGDDYIDSVALRFDADEQGLCQSKRRLIHPKKGVTAIGSWLTIINDDKYRQVSFPINFCLLLNLSFFSFRRQYSRCDYSDTFPLSVHSTCKQNFMYRSLLAIGPDNKPIMEHFQFPSCCKCFITVGHRSNQPDSSPISFGGSSSEDEKRKRSGEKYVLPYWSEEEVYLGSKLFYLF
jgi:hypothetical protein